MKFSMKQCVLLATLLSFIIPIVSAQPSAKDLQRYMSGIRENPNLSLPSSVLDNEKNENNLLDVLVPYYGDTSRIVRQKAFYITGRLGQKSKDPQIQTRAVSYLIQALAEKDTGIRGSALNALTQFRKPSFSAAAKDSIGKYISIQSAHLETLLKLAGFLELQKYTLQIQSVLSSTSHASIKWAARLALARMGDQSATGWIVNKLGAVTVNDDFVYDVVPDLVYTRQPLVFEYLEGIIHSNDANCSSANPDSGKKILCGYRVLEYISSVILNFPISTNESGDLSVQDYQTALQMARSWFASNHTYTLVSETY